MRAVDVSKAGQIDRAIDDLHEMLKKYEGQPLDSGDLIILLRTFLLLLKNALREAASQHAGTGLPAQLKPRPILRCSFCGKHQDEGAKLISGPPVLVCNECVEFCNEILAVEPEGKSPK